MPSTVEDIIKEMDEMRKYAVRGPLYSYFCIEDIELREKVLKRLDEYAFKNIKIEIIVSIGNINNYRKKKRKIAEVDEDKILFGLTQYLLDTIKLIKDEMTWKELYNLMLLVDNNNQIYIQELKMYYFF